MNTSADEMLASGPSIQILQDEVALMHEVLVAARLVAGSNHISGNSIVRLRIALARYDGWLDDPDVRDDLVGRLLRIAKDLDHAG